MKKAAIINDISGFGRCSLSVQLPIISSMQLTACPIPTGIFSYQSAFPNFHYTDLTSQMALTINDWISLGTKIDGLLAGFMTSIKQPELIDGFISQIRPDVVLIDPILGDNGQQFSLFSREYLEKMRGLIKKADIITPNITELCLLSDANYSELMLHSTLPIEAYVQKIVEIGEPLLTDRLGSIIVTGVKQKDKNGDILIHNVLISNKKHSYTTSKYLIGSFSGTGDILAAMMLGYALRGTDMSEALQNTADFLQNTIAESLSDSVDTRFGTEFELSLGSIKL